MTSTTIRTRAAAFGGGIEKTKCMVDADGTVRVWDSVAGYYTTCHALSDAAKRRIRRLARPTPTPHDVGRLRQAVALVDRLRCTLTAMQTAGSQGDREAVADALDYLTIVQRCLDDVGTPDDVE